MQIMHEKIDDFIEQIRIGHVEVYNEFSLQHELGLYLRNHIKSQKIQFERNVSFFDLSKSNFIKREIDISIYDSDKSACEAIELKYPRNGQYPEQMFSFCKDIMFLEQLLEAGFKRAHLLIFADDKCFYTGNTSGIYSYFRGQKVLTGTVQKPTGTQNQELIIKGAYTVTWKPIIDSLHYSLIEIQSPV